MHTNQSLLIQLASLIFASSPSRSPLQSPQLVPSIAPNRFFRAWWKEEEGRSCLLAVQVLYKALLAYLNYAAESLP
uniref:3-ketodihydrosphingosine reductase-like n=1 Tax=Rhizophora mucronata TaxID=61149 RepID=A0A2P2NY85_RHIMU